MNTKTLSSRALNIIDQYAKFQFGPAICSIPYFNNKTVKARGALAVNVGKGSPREIYEEVQSILLKNHIATDSLTNDSLKKFMADNNIGVDCSGFAYYVLNAESEESGKGHLEKHIKFVQTSSFLGKMIASLNPVKNINVTTLADNRNGRVISIKEVQPGDIITMIKNNEGSERNHILVIHQVEYQNFVPTKIHYSHAVAYGSDGLYGSGIKQGVIEILDINKSITEARWTEENKEGQSNEIFMRANNSKTEIRRLNWSGK